MEDCYWTVNKVSVSWKCDVCVSLDGYGEAVAERSAGIFRLLLTAVTLSASCPKPVFQQI